MKQNSKINARELAHSLLVGIEIRGTHASGYAYATKRGMGFHKDHITGSQLPLRDLPRNAKSVILHTRFATQGDESDNTNNHPVISPDGSVAITHNGVISNDAELKAGALSELDLPEVDSSVIAGLLQGGTYMDFNKMSGYAAVAWLRKGEGDVIHLARLKNSPVVWTMLGDGSIVYASTAPILARALARIGLWHGGIMELQEREYITIQNGIITDLKNTPFMKVERYDSWSRYGTATAGGHSTTSRYSTTPTTVAIPKPQTKGSEDAPRIGSTFGLPLDEEDMASGVQVIVPTKDEDWDWENDESWERYFNHDDRRSMALDDEDDEIEKYYTVDTGGNTKGYTTLDALETELRWYAGVKIDESFHNAEGDVRWVEWFVDVGEYDSEEGILISWVHEPALTYKHEDPDNESLSYIREGAGLLSKLKGA